ncbi:hypothetical protein FB45DRAFT_1104186 [Roridomyces roridus]|uniref:Uncharacterized protein n=1 Tax=Roridomyces roridus TaxID=1738132 RepID=A0AAD7FFB2_9AGAR|nr:hypothetical protein FB45DRAFT_1104186 [Roridomyces roridus]
MSSSTDRPSLTLLVREFLICTSLSFIIILGLVHGLLHLGHLYFMSQLVSQPTPIHPQDTTVVRIAQIALTHEYLLRAFKLTIACSVLVFGLWEIAAYAARRCSTSATGGRRSDVEAGNDVKTPFLVDGGVGWTPDVKLPLPPSPESPLLPVAIASHDESQS